MNPHLHTDIAIIGMAALFAGAKDLESYWQNIIDKVDAVHIASDDWAGPYYDPASTENTRIRSKKGGFLEDLAEFNPVEFGIMPSSVDGGEPEQYIALKLARDALWDAGYKDRPFNREKTGVILGRGIYANRGNLNMIQHGVIVDQVIGLLKQLMPSLDAETLEWVRQDLRANLPPFNPEMAPGFVPNITTGRIANRLNLMGPNYLVDGGCASSLISVELAIRELWIDRCDMVIAGGVQTSQPPLSAMMFNQLGGLSTTQIRPFDAKADGTTVGEGAGILVLKRLADAERDGDRIYAVIKGVGGSSDGKALGLLAPRLEGEVLALKRAYTEAGIDPATVGLVEAHGTGMSRGDRTEIESLSSFFGPRQGLLPHCGLGAVKSMIGHCLTAAGAAGIIKTSLALYHKVLPPTLCDQLNPELEIEKSTFFINNEARPWIHSSREHPRRAAVNAFGFGGVNAHAILEEYPQPYRIMADDSKGLPPEPKQFHAQWPTELIVISAPDRAGLFEQIAAIRHRIQIQSDLKLSDLAYSLATSEASTCRLAIVAPSLAELDRKLEVATEKLADPAKKTLKVRSGIYYGEAQLEGKTAFLFPGEGSQYPNMLADLCLYFPKVREWFDLLDEAFAHERQYAPSQLIFPAPTGLTEAGHAFVENAIYAQDVGVEVVGVACRAILEILTDCGITCDGIVGHSSGETTALAVAGVVPINQKQPYIEAMRLLYQTYEKLESAGKLPSGALLTVGNANEWVEEYVKSVSGDLFIAMDNCPNQVVLYGSPEQIEQARDYFKTKGGICSLLPFGRANHTPLNFELTTALKDFYRALNVGPAHTPLYSCTLGDVFPSDQDAIVDVAAEQWVKPVRFREMITKLYDSGYRIFIEVGPRSNLTAFVEDSLRGKDLLALASNIDKRSGLEQLQHLLGRLFVHQKSLKLEGLYTTRCLNRIQLDQAPVQLDKPKTMLKLDSLLPTLKVRPEVAQSVQAKIYGPSPTPVGSEASYTPSQTYTPSQNGSSTNDLQAEKGPIEVAVGDQSSLAAVMTHFDLMQVFLTSQERVSSLAFGSSLVTPQSNLGLEVQSQAYLSSPWLQPETGLILRRLESIPSDQLDTLASLTLTDAEYSYWQSLNATANPEMAHSWLLSCITAKDCIRQWMAATFNLDLPPQAIEIRILPSGKSYGVSTALAELPEISMSSKHGTALVALGYPDYRIGIERELLTSAIDFHHLQLALLPSEQEIISYWSQSGVPTETLILTFWTAKVAAAKVESDELIDPKQWVVTTFDVMASSLTISHHEQMYLVRFLFTEQEVIAWCLTPATNNQI